MKTLTLNISDQYTITKSYDKNSFTQMEKYKRDFKESLKQCNYLIKS